MNLRKIVFPIIIIALVCSGVVFYWYNSRLTDLQSMIDEQQTEIRTLQNQIGTLENQLHTNFFIQSYIAWMAIPRNESHTTPLILQSQYEPEANCTLNIRNEISGVVCSLNATTVLLYSEKPSYVELTIMVTDIATVGNYSLIIEAELKELIKIEIINLTVL